MRRAVLLGGRGRSPSPLVGFGIWYYVRDDYPFQLTSSEITGLVVPLGHRGRRRVGVHRPTRRRSSPTGSAAWRRIRASEAVPVTTVVTIVRSDGPSLRLAIGGAQGSASWVDADGIATPPVGLQVGQAFLWYLRGVGDALAARATASPRRRRAGAGASPAPTSSPIAVASPSPSVRRSVAHPVGDRPRRRPASRTASQLAGVGRLGKKPAVPGRGGRPGPFRPSRLADRHRFTNGGGSTMLKGFKEFILRGNVVDLAVAVVIGAAFGARRDGLRQGPHHAAHRRHLRQARLLDADVHHQQQHVPLRLVHQRRHHLRADRGRRVLRRRRAR